MCVIVLHFHSVQELIQFISERLRVPLYSSPSAKVTSLMLYTQHGREMRRGKILKYLVPSDAASASLMQNAASPSTSPATSPALGGFAVAPAQHPKAGFALPSSAAPAASTALASASHAASSSHVQTTHSSSSSSSSPFSSQLSPSSSGTGSSLYTPTTEAFLYFRANPPQPRVVEPGDFPLHLPAQGSVASSSNVGAHPLMRFSGALTRTLPIFEATFAEHVEQAQAHIEVTDERRRACIAILEANRVRVRGMQAAQRLALSHISRALQRTSGFQKHYAVHAARFHDVLNGFERDLEALMSTEIPKALLSSGDDASAGRGFVPRHVETLLDCHDEGKLRELRSVCDRDLATLEDKVASLEKLAQDVRNGPAKPGLYERQQEQLQHMQRTLVEFDSIRAKQQTLLAALISDRSRVESQIADLVRIMSEQARRRAAPAGADAPEEPVELEASQTITPEELTRGFRIIDENHDRVIMPQLQALEQSANDLIASLGEAQREIDPLFEEDFAFVTQQLKKCRKLEQKTPVYLGAVQDEARQFEQLERLKHMPTALNAFLSELVRRTLYRDTFLERIKSFAERLEAFRLQEQEARRRFVVDHLPFLPPDPKWRKLAKAQPTRCQIELEDHDRYMPELRPQDVPGLVLAHSSEADLLEKEQHAQALAHSGRLVLDVPEFPQSPRDNARQDSSRAADDGGQGAADDDDDDDDDDLGGGGDVTGSMIEYEAQLAEMRERIDQLQHEHASELAALHDKLAKSEARAIEATDNAAHLEVQLNDLSEDNDAKTQRVDQLEEELTSMSMKVSHYLDKTEAWKEIGRTRIAFTNFTAHDLVLMVLNDDGFYSCFNRGAPYRFMSEDSRQAIVTDVANPPRIILGEIIEIEAKRTARRNPDPDGDVYQFNPYRIPFGEHYYVVTIVEISE